MNLIDQLSYEGKAPQGPCSAWPYERHWELMQSDEIVAEFNGPKRVIPERAQIVTAGAGKMAKGFIKSAGQAIMNGSVSKEIRDERYETCKACPFFVEDSKRCSECGCFMEAKTWIGGNPNTLCPKQKWSR